jgi:anti-sigma factor RsiW
MRSALEPITCREMVELVTDYLEGRLPHWDRFQFERHIAGCDGCTRYLEQMRTTIRLTGMLREEDVSAPAREAMLTAFRDWPRAEG